MLSLDGPRLAPLSGKPAQQLIILLHGYGADGHDLIDLAKIWQPSLPYATFIAPHGPAQCEATPFGKQWFSLQDCDPDMLRRDPARMNEAFENCGPGAREAQPILENFIAAELETLSLNWCDVALVGFSQGTMLSLFAGLRQTHPPAGILGYSGALVGASKLPDDITCYPPITLLHGLEDEILPHPSITFAEQGLKATGVDVTCHSRPGLGHSIDEEGIRIGGDFLTRLFAKTTV